LSDLRWRAPLLPAPLTSDHLQLRCEDGARGFGQQLGGKRNPGQRLVLAPGPLNLAGWRGQIQGDLALATARRGQLDLRLAARDTGRHQAIEAHLIGPWRHPTLTLAGSLPLPGQPSSGHQPSGHGTGAAPPLAFRGRLGLDGRSGGLRLGLPQLELTSGRSVLALRGQLWPRLELTSQQLRLESELTQAWPALKPVLGASPRLIGQLTARGTPAQPEIALELAQAHNPLLGSVQTQLSWAHQLLKLESLRAPGLSASGSLPLRLTASGRPVFGNLDLGLDLSRYPLERLTPLVGAHLAGQLTANGRIGGPLQALRPELVLVMDHPGAGPLDLDETWAGRFGPNGELRLRATGDATAGELVARINRRWLPEQVRLSRGGGL
jgi:translocation and assembly module TamB